MRPRRRLIGQARLIHLLTGGSETPVRVEHRSRTQVAASNSDCATARKRSQIITYERHRMNIYWLYILFKEAPWTTCRMRTAGRS